MTYWNAEAKLYSSIGCFSTVGQLINSLVSAAAPSDVIDYDNLSVSDGILPGQCQAFLTTPIEFVWFIEERNIKYAEPGSGAEIPLVTFEPKRLYPAKVTGLNLPLIGNSYHGVTSTTVRWRDGLIRHGSYYYYEEANIESFRPGFGETILSDLEKPIKTATVQTNNLGLPSLKYASGFNTANGLTGPLGRLMSIASYVNPELAKQYDDSKSKKKKVPPNVQDTQDPPEYPPYTPYQDSSGY